MNQIIKQKAAVVTAYILSIIFSKQFGYQINGAYRLEWHELRSLSGQPNLTENYIEEIDDALRNYNLTLSSNLDFLVVDKLNRSKDLRKLHSGLLRLKYINNI